jgi:hypothetical protein
VGLDEGLEFFLDHEAVEVKVDRALGEDVVRVLEAWIEGLARGLCAFERLGDRT